LPSPFFVEVLDIVALDFGAVTQHDGTQIAGGICANDVAFEAAFEKVGDVAAVIDVGVGEYKLVDASSIEGKVLIALVTFVA
jgi:hypothetical protein